MKRKSIKTAILLPSLSALIVGIAVIITVVGTLSSNSASRMTERLMEARVSEYANGFLSYSGDVYNVLKAAAPIIANYIDPAFAEDVNDPRGEAITILSDVLMSNDKIYGMWTCWEPNAFDGKDADYAGVSIYDATGRFTPYVYRDNNAFKVETLVGYDDPAMGGYYLTARNLGKPYVTDPFAYTIDGKETLFYTFAIPIYKDGKVAGVIGADVDLRNIVTMMNSGTILDDGYLFAISPNGSLTTYPDSQYIMQRYDIGWMKGYSKEIDAALTQGVGFDIKAHSDETNESMSFLGSAAAIGDTGRNWLICGIVPEKTVNASSTELLWTIIVIGLVLTVVIGVIINFIISGRLKKLPSLADAAQKISEGNFNVEAGSNRSDEIADVSNALLHVKDTVQRLVNDIKGMYDEFLAGEIESKIDESAYKGEFQTVVREINGTIESLVEGTTTAINLVTEFGNGNFDINIKQYPGKKAILTTSFKTVQANLKKFNNDINGIIEGATDGNLDLSINSSHYNGDWRKMALGINGLISAVVMPVREVIDVLNQLSGGNLDITVSGHYKGEFAVMKSSLNNTLAMLSSYIKEISSILTALSRNDLDQSVDRAYVGAFSEIKTALNIIIEKFNNVVSEISSAAGQVAVGSKQIAASSLALAQGASEQVSSVEELNATVAVINDKTKENAKDAAEAEELSENAKNNAVRGDKDMNNMLASMNSIKESSNNISKIMKVIDDIAFQTNVLALNAAVEAARAGRYGAGFAVVADEVRNLASKSKESATETALLIEESITKINEGVKIAGLTAEAFRTILDNVNGVAGIITHISASSNEQAAAINQVTEGISQITKVVQSSSATSEEAASASEELSSQAEMLANLVSVFKLRKH